MNFHDGHFCVSISERPYVTIIKSHVKSGLLGISDKFP